MLQKYSLLALLLFAGFSGLAQNTDSVTVVNAPWNTQEIAKNVTLLTSGFQSKNLFNSNQNISILEVGNNGKKAVFSLGVEPKELVATSQFGTSQKAIAAINGNFFDTKNGGSVDFVKLNGQIIHENILRANNVRAPHQRAAVVLNKGILAIRKWDGTENWEKNLPEENILLNGPLLSLNGIDEELAQDAFNKNRHPRTCVGIKPDGKVLLVTVDGRNANAEGMSLFELTKVMHWLGCKDIINFDGGGSTTMWVNGNGVVNYPSDNKKWNHEGERKVANVLLVKKK